MHCTILTPCFNTREFIQEAIESVIAQTHKDWDMLIVDDGSTDGTLEVVDSYIREYPISCIRLSQKTGVTNATHIGILNAMGPVITVLDSDDRMTPDSLSVVLPEFEKNPKLGFAWTQFECSDGKIGWSHPLPPGKTLFQALTNKWWKASHQRFFRKSTYQKSMKMDVAIDRSSDFQLALVLSATGCDTKFIPKNTYWYRRRRGGSLTSQGSHIQRDCVGKAIRRVQNACTK